VVSVSPSSNQAMGQWLGEVGFAELNNEDLQNIQEVTGNWIELVLEFCKSCGGEYHNWAELIKKFESDLTARSQAETMLSRFGLEQSLIHEHFFLKTLAEFEFASESDMASLLLESSIINDESIGSFNENDVSMIIQWGLRLGFINFGKGEVRGERTLYIESNIGIVLKSLGYDD
jgi:hypothetical protein